MTQTAVQTMNTSQGLEQSMSWRQILILFAKGLQQSPSTRDAYRKSLVPFFKWCDSTGRDFRSLLKTDIIAYRTYLESPEHPRQSKTIQLYLCAIRQYFLWLNSETGYPNIAAGIKAPRTFTRDGFNRESLTNEQAARLLRYFQDYHRSRPGCPARGRGRRFRDAELLTLRNYAMVNLMLRCGLRTVEVSRLRVMNVAERRGFRVLYIWGKGHARPGEDRQPDDYVRLTDKAYGPVAEYLSARGGHLDPASPLFCSYESGREGQDLTPRMIQMICKNGLRAIGLDGSEYSAHSLRHTTGDMLIEQGASLLDAQTAMRHQSPKTTEIYIRRSMQKSKMESPAAALLDDCFDIEEQ